MTEGVIKPIVGYGSHILRKVCLEVENKPETQIIIKDLLATMSSIDTAVGLAASQINYDASIFAMRLNNNKKMIVINPVIKKRRGSVPSEEGCLSIFGLNAVVPNREEIIDVEFYDEKFNKKKMQLRKFEAIIFLHELDHLNGILFTDRLTKIGREQVADHLSDIEKGIITASYPVIFPDKE